MTADVLILGGGPAGTVTALLATRAGLKATVLERSTYAEERIGETLAPETLAHLQALNIPLDAVPRRVSPGIVKRWDTASVIEEDFITNPVGEGWHVDRRAFDVTLADAAQAQGVRVETGVRLLAARRDDGTWRVATTRGEYCAPWLVDATGRGGWLLHRLGVLTPKADQLVAVFARFSSCATTDLRLALEAVTDGWWSFAPLPGNRSLAVWMTDADTLPRDETALRQRWIVSLNTAALIRERMPLAADFELKVVAAGHAAASVVAGAGWLAVGDAALAPDPLSGSGVMRALSDAHAAVTVLTGSAATMEYYREQHRLQAVEYAAKRESYYQRVRRWPAAHFWKRRHAPHLPRVSDDSNR